MNLIKVNDSDGSLLGMIKEQFFVALISDVLDELGYFHQALPSQIRPLDENLVMVGRARTMLYADIYTPPTPGENPHELEISLVDSLGPGDIAVCACGTSGRIAPWGGLLSTAARLRGATGALMDGMVRDIRDIRTTEFPVFHGGIGPLDSKGRGKVIAIDVRIQCAGVNVEPGDIVFGDADGCVIIPRAIEANVIESAKGKLLGENKTKKALLDGRKLADVFKEFGVL
jgi:4-hydroxy-4-methyl-2-oxoglutarate aldolase